MDENLPTKERQRPEYNEKTMKAMELIEKGVSVTDAHKIATGIQNPHPNSIYDLRRKFDKYLLSKENTVKLASKVFVDTMKMKPTETKTIKKCPECKDVEVVKQACVTCNKTGIVRELLYPSHSNRLEAAREVMNRVDPIVRETSSAVTNIFNVVNLDRVG